MRLSWFQDKSRWPGGSLAVRVKTLLSHVYDVYSAEQADRIPSTKASNYATDTSDFMSDAMSCGEAFEDLEIATELENYLSNTIPLQTNNALDWYRVSGNYTNTYICTDA